MKNPQLILPPNQKLKAVLFAGGGGSCEGIEMATGTHVDIAINHNEDAISMHRANHPQARHYIADVFEVDPLEATGGQYLGYLHASPDCTHFSQARGGQPRNEKIRALPWVVVRWAGRLRKRGLGPDCITLENVRQILKWGPLIAKRCPHTGRVVRLDGTVAPAGEHTPRSQQFLVPDPKREGQTWRRFVAVLRAMGASVEARELVASNYGTPQRRERLMMVAQFDGRPIVWPEPEFHKRPRAGKLPAGKKTWRGAYEAIDFNLPCRSIFDRPRPLADATMRRIARGVVKYVLESADPFIVRIGHTGSNSGKVQPLGEPLSTVTSKAEHCFVAPSLAPLTHQGGVRVNDVRDPMPTVTGANRGELALIAPILAGVGGRAGQTEPHPANLPMNTVTSKADTALVAPVLVQAAFGEGKPGGVQRWGEGCKDAREPLGTITASGGGGHCLAAPVLIQAGYGEREGQAPRALDIMEPLGTITAGGIKHAVAAAFLAQMNGGGYTGCGNDLREPSSTVTTSGSQQQLVAAHLAHLRGNCDARDMNEPLMTVSANGQHHAVVECTLSAEHEAGALRVAAFLMRYYGQGGQWSDLRDPMTTVTTKDRMALVTVVIKGTPYVVVDIGLRMLEPSELFAATGFPPTYKITHGHDGRRFTKSKQVKLCGNSVPPQLQAAITRANYSDRPAARMAA